MKNKTTAGLLSLFLGVFGVQFFYLGNFGLGIMAIAFTFSHLAKWSVLLGLIQGIILLTMDKNEFNKKYNTKWWKDEQNRRNQGHPPQNQQYPPQYPPQQQQYPPKQQYPPRYEPATPPVNTGSLASQERAKIEVLRQEGLKKQAEYDFKGAIEAFGKAIDIDGKDNLLHWQLACCYSEEEHTNLALYHLEKAIQNGFKDFEKIKKEDTLAFLRIQPEFEPFVKNNYKRVETIENQGLLDRLKHLASLRERGMLSEKDFAEQSKQLFQ
jgi:TM2 domain-containing membrane protein YozV